MVKFIVGLIIGFILGAVGVTGAVKMMGKAVPVVDAKVVEAQKFIKEQAK
jgi:hypothetical protein